MFLYPTYVSQKKTLLVLDAFGHLRLHVTVQIQTVFLMVFAAAIAIAVHKAVALTINARCDK